MPLTLAVEDGTGSNPDANSYVALQDVRDFATFRGLTAPSDDATLTAQLIKGMDYLSNFSDKFQGRPAQPGIQPLDWPRTDFYPFGCYADMYPDDALPPALKNALCQLAILAGTIDFAPSTTTMATKQKVIGGSSGISTTFSEILGTNGVPFLPSVDVFLKPLLVRSSGGLTNYRI